MNRRIQRVEKELRNTVASYLLVGLKDPVSCFFSVSRVEVSPDLRHAKVFISFVNQKLDEQNIALETIQNQAPAVQNYIAKSLPMKFCPKLTFLKDFGAEHSQKIDKILSSIEKKGSNHG